MNKEIVLEVVTLKKWFPVRKDIISSLLSKEQTYVKAVDGVSFEIRRGEIFGLAGESGCGKTTTGKTILRLLEPTAGEIRFEGIDLATLRKSEIRAIRKKMQIIYQDPYESLNPRMRIFDIVCEPISVHELAQNLSERREMVAAALEDVELSPAEEFVHRYPHELSGGQRQRVAIARALVLGPRFIVADEPISMLDVSIRAGILSLMLKLELKFHMSYLFITHDLAVARHVCHRLAIMYLGKIVEVGPTENLIANPLHPYTAALMTAVPVPDPTAERIKIAISGEVSASPTPPSGCRFHPRCPCVLDTCKSIEPELTEVNKEHLVACHSATTRQ